MLNFEKVLESGKIGNLEIKNRLISSPLLTGYAAQDGNLTERFIKYYEEKAKGGFGLVVTENHAIDPKGAGFNACPGFWEGIDFSKHRELVKSVHAHGAKIFVQLYHAGRVASPAITGVQPVAPSAIPDPAIGVLPHALSVDEIIELEDRFVYAIEKAKACGYDGVELLGSSGYLLCSFASPFSNKRSDEYGGNVQNRLRFVLNILRKAYAKVGRDFNISYKMSAVEYVEGGLTIEDSKINAMLLQDAGVKAFNISGGLYKSADKISAPYQERIASFADLAQQIKSVVNVPVIAVNKIHTPFAAESVLRQGKSDYIMMGRGSLADPHIPNKIKAGDIDSITQCIACGQGCAHKLFNGEPVSCLVNPRTGREYKYDLNLVAEPKRVMVIGGGLAGMQAAVVAAQKGHSVELFEKGDRLGGQWLLASIPPNKEVFSSLIVSLKHKLHTYSVTVHLNTEVGKEQIDAYQPEHIILATGATPRVFPIQGIESHPNVVLANDILSGDKQAASNVVVIGGGLVGVETAEHMAVHGSNVSVIEMKSTHLEEMPATPKKYMLRSLDNNGVSIHLDTKIAQVNADSIRISPNQFDAETQEIQADQIVLAMGSNPENSLLDMIKDRYRYTQVGDSLHVANGLEAIKQGYEAALNI